MIRKVIKILKLIRDASPHSAFKIVSVHGDPKNKDTQITYQVRGKATTTTEKPNLLINELMQIKGFSKEDAELIYNLAVAEKISYSFRIISIIFEENIIFEIEDLHSKYTLLLTAEEIISTNTMLKNFSPNDISMIYFQLMRDNQNYQRIPKNEVSQQGKIYFLQKPGVNK